MRNGKQSSDKLRSHKRLLYDKRPIEKATEFETSCANQMCFFSILHLISLLTGNDILIYVLLHHSERGVFMM